MAMSIDDRQELALELYRSRHGLGTGTLSVNGGTIRRTIGRKPTGQAAAAASLGKSPPRPSPASVAYHSDEESLKCYDENPDDSSVTEKPSEVSSSESQVCLNSFQRHLLIGQDLKLASTFLNPHSILKAKTKAFVPTRIHLSTTTQM